MESSAAATGSEREAKGREAKANRAIARGEFIESGDPRWMEFLERARHDIYQWPGYAEVDARYLGGRSIAFLGEVPGASCLIPLTERWLPAHVKGGEAYTDAISPYAMGGPVFQGDTSRAHELLALFAKNCRERRLVAAYLRIHALLEPDWATQTPYGVLMQRGEMVWVDLRRPEEELRAELSPRRRRGLRKVEKAGFVAELDDWSQYERFKQMYGPAMTRLRATPFYHFSSEYFDDLRASLGDKLHLCTVRAPDGTVCDAGTYTIEDGIVEYHLGCTDEAWRKHAPSQLRYDFMCRWARSVGAEIYNLGGGLPSLMEFKTGFATTRAKNYSIRIVGDPEGYAALLRDNGIDAPADGADGFFPAYRGPE
ncbi:MAG TPA: GNAT family N-acetyltransferase [Vulgatibacter sp.]|nr:GNAT family N-acetyltransferase [Vulgatibacter sp.]